MYKQMSIFDIIVESEPMIPLLLNKGDTVYKVVLGEIEKFSVLNNFLEGYSDRGYRLLRETGGYDFTHNGDIGVNVFKSLDEAKKLAMRNLLECKTLILNEIKEYKRWEYVRESDNYLLIAELGIIENYVYFHDWYSYRFAIPFKNEKEKNRILNKSLKEITTSFNADALDFHEVEVSPNKNLGIRLYWSNFNNQFADYRYAYDNNYSRRYF